MRRPVEMWLGMVRLERCEWGWRVAGDVTMDGGVWVDMIGDEGVCGNGIGDSGAREM